MTAHTTTATVLPVDASQSVEVTVSAYAVPEAAWEPLRAVLGCLPGDLGRWKGGRHVTLDVNRLTRDSSATLADLTGWLRSQGIAHRVEVETSASWTPGAAAPATASLTFTAEQLDVLVAALGDAGAYREAEGGCGWCDHAALKSGDDDALCEDHEADEAAAGRYAALATLVGDARRSLL